MLVDILAVGWSTVTTSPVLVSDCKSLTMMKDSIKRKCLVSIDTVSLQGLTKTAGDNHYHTR